MMAKITIDGQPYEVDAKLTIIQAALEQGIVIPHFCWHPRLTVAGNCRMCLVEVEKMPKLVIACSTQVAEGMVIRTRSDKVVNAQQAVMEFLLINHPLDCPICDEAGECKLQDYAYKYGEGVSRFEFAKVRKPKRVELGPNVMLDTERCIMCSRCIRFCDEIAKKPQLVFTKRADHVELTTFPGERLDNPYSMNTIDICPVGALTSRAFRFHARVWEMSSTDSICTGCARGCNTKIWVRNNEILRLTPRFNPEVNDHWMCDHGRLNTFRFVNAENRIKAPLIRKEGKLTEVGWDEAVAKVAFELKSYRKNEIALIGSPYATNEDNYLLARFATFLGSRRTDFLDHVVEGDEDAILLRADKTPNKRGAIETGVRPRDTEAGLGGIIREIGEGKIKALYAIDDVAAHPAFAEVLPKLEFLVVQASNENATTAVADVVLSSSAYAERQGTMTNFQGRVQRIRAAVATAEQDRALDGFSMSRLDKFGANNDRWTKGIRRDARPAWRTITAVANAMGAKWRYASAEEVFKDLTSAVPAFRGMSYARLGTRGLQLSGQKEKSPVKV